MPCIPKDSWRPECPRQSEGEEEQQRGEDGDGGGRLCWLQRLTVVVGGLDPEEELRGSLTGSLCYPDNGH